LQFHIPQKTASPNIPSKIQPQEKPLQFRIPQRVSSPPRVPSKIQEAFNGSKRFRRDDETPSSSSRAQKRSHSGRWHEVETAAHIPRDIQQMFDIMQSEVDKLKEIALDAKQTASEAKQSAMEVEIASLKRQLAAQDQRQHPWTPSSSTNRLVRTAPFEYTKENTPPIKQEWDAVEKDCREELFAKLQSNCSKKANDCGS
jgi:hypothetical protein